MDTADSSVFAAEGARPERQAAWPLRQDVFSPAVAEDHQSPDNATGGFEYPLDDAVGLTTQDVGFEEPEFEEPEFEGEEMESPFVMAGKSPAVLMSEATDVQGWSGDSAQLDFRDRVLASHIERSRRSKGPPRPDLRDSQLSPVPGTPIKMATAAAVRAGELLHAANAVLAASVGAGTDVGSGTHRFDTVRITAQSGYRGSEHQRRLWCSYFPRYYNETITARQRLPEGPHSPAAVTYMLENYRLPDRIAAPGFSNHQAGVAIDFKQILRGKARIQNSTHPAAIAQWRETWFFQWLQANAARFGFQPYTREPWHWEYRPQGGSRESEALGLEPAATGVAGEDLGPEEAEEPELETWPQAEPSASERLDAPPGEWGQPERSLAGEGWASGLDSPGTDERSSADELWGEEAGYEDGRYVGETDRAGRQSSAAKLEWVNLTLTPGGDGKGHLYYLTSGPPGGGPSKFRLKVTNTNSVYNFKNPSLMVRLRASTGPDQSVPIPLEGQGEKAWKRIVSGGIEDETARIIELYLDGATRWRAYDADNPLRWLDVEYQWYQGGLGSYSAFFARTSLAFFLVAPVELLVRQKRLVQERSLDDPASRGDYWRLLWENSDPNPVEFTVSIQASVTDARTGQVSVTTGTTVTHGTERSQGATATSELSVGFDIEKMFSLGQKLSTSVTSGVRWSESTARQFAVVASRTRTFTEGHQQQLQVKGTIPAAPSGRRQALYLYPIMGIYEVPVVLFGGANEFGQATRRSTGTVPVAWLRGWGTCVVLR